MARPSILIIDDEAGLIKSIERALKREFHIISAQNGEDGVDLASYHQPDLIILDIIMPGMDGFDTCEAIRAKPALAHIPILFLSALSNVESRLRGFEVGADDYITKPFDLRELRLRVHAILRRAQYMPQPEVKETLLHHKDVTLNCESFEVCTQAGENRLTPIEFDLLHYFMTHPGQTFSTDRLLREVWDYPVDTGSPELVRMHIRNLRHKIEPVPNKPIYIKTVYRQGYIMP